MPTLALLELILDLTTETPAIQAKQVLADENYRRGGRFQLNPNVAIDDYKQLNNLKQQTEEYMKTEEWQDIRSWVGRVWT